MNEQELYREAANGLERTSLTLRIHATKLQHKAEERRQKARRQKVKAEALDRAAVELLAAADAKDTAAKEYRDAARIVPRLDKRCLGCALGYVPEGETYNSIHTCGQTVGRIASAG